MSSYFYEAVDTGGLLTRGTLDVADQGEALRRIREMGLFPTKIAADRRRDRRQTARQTRTGALKNPLKSSIPFLTRNPRGRTLSIFTRQIATLVEAGMPLLRGLRTLQEQETNIVLKRMLGDLGTSIESGNSLSEALAAYPKVFNNLYVNMVKAGELSGALEVTLRRLAEFMEKAQRIKGKIKSAMFYPCAVMFIATLILTALMLFVIPRFQQVFDGLGAHMPPVTLFILKSSALFKENILIVGLSVLGGIAALMLVLHTAWGRRLMDRCKLRSPIFGPLFRKVAISRFTRTLGTLLNSGVPILQALTIVKETAGNVVVANVISKVHDRVKEGDTISVPLKESGVFPAMVAGMVDVGEQTGALPDMLMKIADTYDEEVDNAVGAMTSLLEPILIVFLAIAVGGIVIALFLPIIDLINQQAGGSSSSGGGSEI
jgi:type IV pilus assembly protein PilC